MAYGIPQKSHSSVHGGCTALRGDWDSEKLGVSSVLPDLPQKRLNFSRFIFPFWNTDLHIIF